VKEYVDTLAPALAEGGIGFHAHADVYSCVVPRRRTAGVSYLLFCRLKGWVEGFFVFGPPVASRRV
jgi:hypothetical protein